MSNGLMGEVCGGVWLMSIGSEIGKCGENRVYKKYSYQNFLLIGKSLLIPRIRQCIS